MQVVVEGGDDVAVDVVCPQTRVGAGFRGGGEESRGWVEVFELGLVLEWGGGDRKGRENRGGLRIP